MVDIEGVLELGRNRTWRLDGHGQSCVRIIAGRRGMTWGPELLGATDVTGLRDPVRLALE